MRRAILPILALSLAAPVSLSAQRPVPERHHMAAERMLQAGPLARILAQRETLGLTAEQVSRLEAIEARLQAQNVPLRDQLRDIMGDSLRRGPALRGGRAPREHMREGGGQLTPEQRSELRAQRERVRERMSELTPEQRAEVRERVRTRRAERPGPTEEQAGAMRPIMEQLRENAARAMQEARDVLTPEQQSRLRELHPRPARGRGIERAPRRSLDGR